AENIVGDLQKDCSAATRRSGDHAPGLNPSRNALGGPTSAFASVRSAKRSTPPSRINCGGRPTRAWAEPVRPLGRRRRGGRGPTAIPPSRGPCILLKNSSHPEDLAAEEHRFSMAAENIVGDLAEKLEP